MVNKKELKIYNENTEKLISGYHKDVKDLLNTAESKMNLISYYNRNYKEPKLITKLKEHLKNGGKPSAFFKELEMPNYISDEYLEKFYYSIDNVINWQIGIGYYRRSFRAKEYFYHTERIIDILALFRRYSYFKITSEDVVKGNIKKDINEMIPYFSTFEYLIAAELDFGNTSLEKALEDVIFEDSGTMSTAFIRGIVMSKSTKFYDALGKLLLAARLQEGLRQAICENADAGRPEAFSALFKVILDNDLMRFSSIKRALWTWTGLYTEQIKDLDRISNKQFELIYDYMTNEEKREAALKSQDNMELYLALWSYGANDITKASNIAKDVIYNGTHHQRLTSTFYLNTLGSNVDLKDTSKAIVDKFRDELDTTAIIFERFMSKAYVRAWEWKKECLDNDKKISVDLKDHFENEAECRYFYDVLKEILSHIKANGKEVSFESCVFPWVKAWLTCSDIIKKMAWCAAALDDNDLIDEVSGMLNNIKDDRYYYYASRDTVLVLLLNTPKTQKQRNALINAVSNAETNTRNAAFKLVKKLVLSDEEYLSLENMLKYKKTDIRENIINLLMGQSHEKRLASIERLLNDKKEEKRTAALDMLIQLKNIDNSGQIQELALSVATPTAKEQILIDEILNERKKDKKSGFGLYDQSADYTPILEGEYIEECKKIFMDCFPNSKAFNTKGSKNLSNKLFSINKGNTKYHDEEISKKLKALIEKNENLEYKDSSGETRLLKNHLYETVNKDGNNEYPFMDMWRKFYDDEIKDVFTLFRLALLFSWNDDEHSCFDPLKEELFGKEFVKCDFKNKGSYNLHLRAIFHSLIKEKYLNGEFDPSKLAAAAAYYLIKNDKQIKYTRTNTAGWRKGYEYSVTIYGDAVFSLIIPTLRLSTDTFPYNYALLKKLDFENNISDYRNSIFTVAFSREIIPVSQIIHAYGKELFTKEFLFKLLLTQGLRQNTFESLSSYIKFIREKNALENSNTPIWLQRKTDDEIINLLGHSIKEKADTDEKYLAIAEECYNKIIDCVLYVELSRGDTATVFSHYIKYITRIYGAKNFVKILNALGNETLERNISRYSYYLNNTDKKGSLSRLLKHCIPEPNKKTEEIEIIKNSNISKKRLTEAAMYSTDWLGIIGDVLAEKGFESGCYYFIAHMNDIHSEMQTAMIAKYTPLTIEELKNGAFDVQWFREVYNTLGEKNFNNIYAAAKYITDGAKHSRARKFADAALGKFDKGETEKLIKDKRNKDLLIAYPLIPYKNEKDVKERYLFIQSFLKESKQFGAQRRASEKLACETAVKNMATMLGYPDETRLILTVEGDIAEDMKDLFIPAAAEDISAYIALNKDGKVDIICEKDGKQLKSVPARLKKNERINVLKEAKKTLNDQRSRVIKMLESSMESETEFKYGELENMLKSPVVKNQADRLVFKKGDRFGFLADFSDSDKNDILQIAHPYHFYKANVWKLWQEKLFGAKIKQPFKQVFRELYIKTNEETDSSKSLRYSGNQINPQKTSACLKGRGWIADYEKGLQKVYYKENIIAEIYALADWFSPSDIEEPTLEYVVFTDRKTFENKKIKDIPDVIFSEIMRDVDLAVSVAHAGGIDPELSHSTVEMRRAIAELTANMLTLKNVEFTQTHAVIKGNRAEYSLHLGSGVIHIKGGAMLNILPVHSQQRGRIFLPFVDDDPKTAEILSKLIMLSEDIKIKDPYILNQL